MLWVVHDTLGFSLLYSSYRGRAMFTVNPLPTRVRLHLSYLQPPSQKNGQANTASFWSSYVTPLAPSVDLRFSYADPDAASASLDQRSQGSDGHQRHARSSYQV